ncbi:hypothetical protein QZH41_017047, partial [Actinostola sp. cb2023]
KTCSLRDPLTWLIQGKFPSNLTSVGQNIVIAFQLSVTNTSDMEDLSKVVMAGTPGERVEEGALLAHDALVVIAKATGDAIQDNRWNQSLTTAHCPRTTNTLGVTGIIDINSQLEREVAKLQVWNLNNNKPVQIGLWTSSGSVVLSQSMSINFESDLCKQPPLAGHTIRITTVEVHPYIIRYTTSDGTMGYKGFCIDLLDHLALDLGFKYVIEYSPDKKYGALINGEWNGMIRQLVDKKSDMAVAALTVTESREKAVDFTVAYQHYTDDMIFARPADEDNLFIFVDPLSHSIWFCLAGTVCFVGVVTYLLKTISVRMDGKMKTAKEQRKSSRSLIVCGFLWHVSCNRELLIAQRLYQVDASLLGSTGSAFSSSCPPTQRTLQRFFTAKSAATTIKKHPEHGIRELPAAVYRMSSRKTFPDNSMMGIEWARTKKYVHIADGPILKYAVTQKPCNLMTAPGLSTPKGLAFALQPGSIYKKNITLSLLRMREKGILDERQDYWWVKQSSCPKYDTN